jgi:glycosyltransferase involved in cell wall biosynthesis
MRIDFLKIALLSHMVVPIAEPFIGGMESFFYHLATGLRRQGIDIVCYACAGSFIPGVEIRTCDVPNSDLVYPQPVRELNGEQLLDIRAREDTAIYRVLQNVCEDPEITLLHNHSGSGIPFYLEKFIHVPMLHTLHYPPDIVAIIEALRFCTVTHTEPHVVAVSQTQARYWQPYYPINDIIHNGLDLTTIPYSLSHDGTLTFVGRMDPNKGVEDAIEVATRLGKQLHIYGAPLPSARAYFEKHIQPLLLTHDNVTYHGSVDQQTLFAGLQKTQALLFPVKWDEPFGNVIVEAMAVGTPVIMYNRGSAQELIKDGLSGYVIPKDNLAAMVAAVVRTEVFDRAACAQHARAYFSMEACIQKYLALYQRISYNTQYVN